MPPSLEGASRPNVEPHAQLRRSFVYRKLQHLGARFETVNGSAVAVDFGKAAAEAETAKILGLADLSPLPRTGFKGTGAVEWLQAQGLEIGPDSNRGYRQPNGEVALRLAPTEIFLIDSLAGGGALVGRLNQAWSWGTEKPRKLIGYPTPRADSHAWFALSGKATAEMFAKICGIDLRLEKFEQGRIAQTSIAKMSGIILRQDQGTVPVFHLLADSASADYLWEALLDAMAEFGGAPVGLAALRSLG